MERTAAVVIACILFSVTVYAEDELYHEIITDFHVGEDWEGDEVFYVSCRMEGPIDHPS